MPEKSSTVPAPWRRLSAAGVFFGELLLDLAAGVASVRVKERGQNNYNFRGQQSLHSAGVCV